MIGRLKARVLYQQSMDYLDSQIKGLEALSSSIRKTLVQEYGSLRRAALLGTTAEGGRFVRNQGMAALYSNLTEEEIICKRRANYGMQD